MLTVSILINGRPVHTRSVVNRLDELGGYVCDDGTLIEHDPADGAVALAIKALRTIREVPPRQTAPSIRPAASAPPPGEARRLQIASRKTIRMTAHLDGPRGIERDLPADWWTRTPAQRSGWLTAMQNDLVAMLAADTIDYTTEPFSQEYLTGAGGPDDPDWNAGHGQ